MTSTDEFSIKSLLAGVKHLRMIVGGILAFLTMLAASASWWGTQLALPASVAKLDTAVVRIETRIDALSDSVRQDRTSVREALDLLLRLNCPRTGQPDLLRECRPYQSPRRN